MQNHYFLVELNHIDGYASKFVFWSEENAKKCINKYLDIASKDVLATGGNCSNTSELVYFYWESPVGRISWRVTLSRLSTEDNNYQNF